MEKSLHMLYILRQVNQRPHSRTDQLVEIELSIIARAWNGGDSEFINLQLLEPTWYVEGKQRPLRELHGPILPIVSKYPLCILTPHIDPE